jgi:ascorbate-specific PTS system EIIC-type component UlaA
LGKLVKFIIGLLMMAVGLMGLVTYVDPEMPIRATFKLRSLPVEAITRPWFEFANNLQQMNAAEYGGYALLFFGLAVAGALTLWKTSRQK